jgi:hypothetical protein
MEKGWQSLVVVGTLSLVILCLMYTGHYLDGLALQEMEALKKADKSAVEKLTRLNRGTSMFMSFRDTKIRDTDVSHVKEAMKSANNANGNHATTSFLKIAEEALPQVLSSRSYAAKYKDELKRHHRWVAVFFHFTKKFPRVLRILALATNIITMLFIQSITYNLTHGDDGSCERLHSEEACLEPVSSFSTGSSKCYWIPQDRSDMSSYSAYRYGGSCKFVQPDSDFTIIIFVAIFSAVVSTPIAFTADWIIQNILCAPTDTSHGKKSKQKVGADETAANNNNPRLSKIMSIVPAPNQDNASIDKMNRNTLNRASNQRRKIDVNLLQQMSGEMMLTKKAQKDFDKLQEQLIAYRATLEDQKEFDGKFT